MPTLSFQKVPLQEFSVQVLSTKSCTLRAILAARAVNHEPYNPNSKARKNGESKHFEALIKTTMRGHTSPSENLRAFLNRNENVCQYFYVSSQFISKL